MIAPELKSFTIGEREAYLNNYCALLPGISDFTFSSLFMWADFYSLRLSCFHNLSCIICTGGDFLPSLLMPVGNYGNDLKRLIDYYYDLFAERGLDFYISHVEERFIPLIKSVEGYKYEVTYNRDYSDYIYDRESFITMNGSGYRSNRQKISSFKRHYPDHTYSRLNKEDIPECLELVELWRKQKGYDADANETGILLANYEALGLRGGAIRVGGEIKSFFAGEVYGMTGYIIVGKADMHIHGLYLHAIKEFVKNEFPEALYINRCEDLGIETLRDAKMSWMPAKILHKYNIHCSRI